MHSQVEESEISNQVAKDILKSIHIPPCPDVVVALMEEVRQPEVDFSKLVKLISGDVGLAASMLKTANSPFFALRSKVSSIQQAVAVLGLKNLTQIIRSSALQNALGGDQVSMERFWERSNFTAVVATHITARLHNVSREDAYTLGLFHDCGIPVLMQKFPDYKEKLAAANQSADLVVTIEDQHYTTNHAIVGNMLARNWFLPAHISQAILVHHDLTVFDYDHEYHGTEIATLVAVTQVATHIATTFLGKSDDAEWLVCGPMALDYLGINTEDVEDIAEDAVAELEEIRAYR